VPVALQRSAVCDFMRWFPHRVVPGVQIIAPASGVVHEASATASPSAKIRNAR